MRHIIFLTVLLASNYKILFASCCSSASTQVLTPRASTLYSPATKGPTPEEMSRADAFLKDYRQKHPRTIAMAQEMVNNGEGSSVDGLIILALLQSNAEHLKPIRDALKFKIK